MSKRAEDKAMYAWAVYEYREHPKGLYHTCFVDGYQEGYEQAEKDTIERAVMWLEKHADEYNLSESSFDHMEEEMITDFRKAMEEE